MTATTAGALDLALEINRVTAGTSDMTLRLAELWPQLRTVIPFAFRSNTWSRMSRLFEKSWTMATFESKL